MLPEDQMLKVVVRGFPVESSDEETTARRIIKNKNTSYFLEFVTTKKPDESKGLFGVQQMIALAFCTEEKQCHAGRTRSDVQTRFDKLCAPIFLCYLYENHPPSQWKECHEMWVNKPCICCVAVHMLPSKRFFFLFFLYITS